MGRKKSQTLEELVEEGLIEKINHEIFSEEQREQLKLKNLTVYFCEKYDTVIFSKNGKNKCGKRKLTTPEQLASGEKYGCDAFDNCQIHLECLEFLMEDEELINLSNALLEIILEEKEREAEEKEYPPINPADEIWDPGGFDDYYFNFDKWNDGNKK